jgi:hypothetical protein
MQEPKDLLDRLERVSNEHVDWHIDRDERMTHLQMMQTEYHQDFRGGNRAAEWRLRCKRQANIVSELSKLGRLAVLLAGPLLCASKSGIVEQAERFSSWRETLDNSPVMYFLNKVQRAQFFGLKSESWNRLEGSIQSLGHCLCLAIKNLNNSYVLEACNKLKISLIKRALGSDQNLDNVINYIKWLGKSCQFVLLRAVPQEPPEGTAIIANENGEILPFIGQWSFVSDLIKNRKRRKKPLTTYQARFLGQMGNTPRALPHPSMEQSKKDVRSSVAAFQSEFKPSKAALDKYRHGITSILQLSKGNPPFHSHVSLVSKGKLDASRTQGGGAAVLVAKTRRYTDQVLTVEILDDLSEKLDQFGQFLIDPLSMLIAKDLLGITGCKPEAYTCIPTLGDILYLKPEEIEKVWKQTLNSNQRVPTKLAQLLTLTSSDLIREVGFYNEEPEIIHNVLTFEKKNIFFTPNKPIPVKAGISIEAGLKSRLTTSGWAAFAHLSQLPSNYMRHVLSRDPFVRIGFREQDKFWEVLKTYKTRHQTDTAKGG